MHENEVFISGVNQYNSDLIYYNLNDSLFECIKENDTVVLKPNWVKESHLEKPEDWEYIITHPSVITAAIQKVLFRLGKGGKIIITDGPQTDSTFDKIISKYPTDLWQKLCKSKNVELEIIDLREDEWISEDGVIISRRKLPGDPKGDTEVNLLDKKSEFYGHQKSKRGYYGADYNIEETNNAHDGHNNLYRISRSVIESDVFINLPKLKTHKKAGITCCLKNLVGINTYKNFLPHHTEGSLSEGGDQFPEDNLNSKIAGPLMAFFKQNLLNNKNFAKFFKPIKKLGEFIFGKTSDVIRSGNWYGNDTLWRMVLDLNKIIYYANSDGSLREDNLKNRKKYIGIVDGIIGGEGRGPMAPDPVKSNYIISGTNPLAIDSACARIMGFDPIKIPVISNSFNINKYKISDFKYDDIKMIIDGSEYTIKSSDLDRYIKHFRPHFGWEGHIEWNNDKNE
jgi:uncharacterized protein (DUF362 family)